MDKNLTLYGAFRQTALAHPKKNGVSLSKGKNFLPKIACRY